MDNQPLNSYQVADLLVHLQGPYHTERVVEAAWTVDELVRRLNHATIGPDAARLDPQQVNRTIAGLRDALHRLEQTFDQLAKRLDVLSADPQVTHHRGADPATRCAQAASELRQAAASLGAVTAPLAKAGNITSDLQYSTVRSGPFPPSAPATGIERLPPGDQTAEATRSSSQRRSR